MAQCESKSVICLDGDDEREPTPKKVKKLNVCEEKAKRIEEIAVELRNSHKDNTTRYSVSYGLKP